MKKVCKLSFILICIGVMLVSSIAYAGITQRVTISSDGVQANQDSYSYFSISANGRFVVFQSLADNLTSGDTNGCWDIFVHDRQTGITECVSISSNGVQGNNNSYIPTISADGRFVAFQSYASNLVSDDTNGTYDIFVHDRQTGITQLVSKSSAGVQANSQCWLPSISEDGRIVVFESDANNLVSGDTNGYYDIFVYDMQTGITERVSILSDGVQANSNSTWSSINADGRYVTFYSSASNLVTGDSNNNFDVFVHDRQTGITERVSVSSAGVQGNNMSIHPFISADGRFVTFNSYSSNLVSGDTNGNADIFVHDRQTSITERVSVSSEGVQGNNSSHFPTLSADGRFVAFQSYASNLVPNDTNSFPNELYSGSDIFVYDRQAGIIQRVSLSSDDEQANNNCGFAHINADGSIVAFASKANTLVAGDTNNCYDIFVNDSQGTVVQGSVELQNFNGDITAIPLIIEFGNGIDPITLNLDVEGNFTILDVPYGTYNARIKATHWLAKTTSGVVVNENTAIDPVILINGDVVDNNEIDFSDINAVRAAYGSFPGDETWNAMADVDGSGEVDFTDINIVRSNYGEIGD